MEASVATITWQQPSIVLATDTTFEIRNDDNNSSNNNNNMCRVDASNPESNNDNNSHEDNKSKEEDPDNNMNVAATPTLNVAARRLRARHRRGNSDPNNLKGDFFQPDQATTSTSTTSTSSVINKSSGRDRHSNDKSNSAGFQEKPQQKPQSTDHAPPQPVGPTIIRPIPRRLNSLPSMSFDSIAGMNHNSNPAMGMSSPVKVESPNNGNPIALCRPTPVRAASLPPSFTLDSNNHGNSNNAEGDGTSLSAHTPLGAPHTALPQIMNNPGPIRWNMMPNMPAPNMQLPPPPPNMQLPPPQPQAPKKRRSRRHKPSWYHNVAANNRLGSIQETFQEEDQQAEEEEEEEGNFIDGPAFESSPGFNIHQHHNHSNNSKSAQIRKAKRDLLGEINRTGGETKTPAFQAALQQLIDLYDKDHFDPRNSNNGYKFGNFYSDYYSGWECQQDPANELEGIGISAGKPSFPGCVGRNDQGDPMYKLGTMSFDMFCPTQLVTSIQGTFVLIDNVDGTNPEQVKNVPKNLLADVRDGKNPVRTYNIVTPFTIEPWKPEFGENSPNKGVEEPIRGVMTTYGFLLPYPTQTHRFSVWFTGGSLQVDDSNNQKWFQIFDKDSAQKRTTAEAGKVMAAKMLMGATVTNNEMDEDGKLSYSLNRPIPSHIDLLYMDKTLQIFRASSGTVYVHVRLTGDKANNTHEQQAALLGSGSFLPSMPADPWILQDNSESSEQSAPLNNWEDNEEGQPVQATPVGATEEEKTQTRVWNFAGRLGMKRFNSDSNFRVSYDTDGSSTSQPTQQEGGTSLVVKKSCLKKSSSYGKLEQLGSNIPINRDRKAWMALPVPSAPPQEANKPDKKRSPSKIISKIKRVHSDPSLIWNSFSHTGDVLDDCASTDSSSDSSTSVNDANKPQQTEEQPSRGVRRSVSFSNLEVRSYNITVGDHPCARGPAISLDWTYQQQVQMPLQRYEFVKHCRQQRGAGGGGAGRRLSAHERSVRLHNDFGFGMDEIQAAVEQAEMIRRQQERDHHHNNRHLGIIMHPRVVQHALTSVKQKAKKLVRRTSDKGCAA